MLMPVVLAMAVGSPLAGRYLDKVGSKAVITVGTTVLAVGMLLLSRSAASLPLFIISGALIGLGLSALLGAPMRYIVLNEAPAEDRGSAQGVLTVFTGVGQLISGALIGAAAASAGGGVGGLQLRLSDHRARFGRVDRAVVRPEGASGGAGNGAGEHGAGLMRAGTDGIASNVEGWITVPARDASAFNSEKSNHCHPERVDLVDTVTLKVCPCSDGAR